MSQQLVVSPCQYGVVCSGVFVLSGRVDGDNLLGKETSMEKLPLLVVLNELMTFYSEARQCKGDRYAVVYDLD